MDKAKRFLSDSPVVLFAFLQDSKTQKAKYANQISKKKMQNDIFKRARSDQDEI